MVSVALLTREDNGPILRELWTAKELKMARRAARKTLEAVGDKTTDIPEEGSITTLIRRRCTDDERKGVVESFLE